MCDLSMEKLGLPLFGQAGTGYELLAEQTTFACFRRYAVLSLTGLEFPGIQLILNRSLRDSS